MRGTAYARIFYPRGEKDPSRRRIYVGERTWDGIDRPDYSDQFKLTPAEARYLGQEQTITMPALGIHNGVWAMLLGVVLYVGVSLATQPPPEEVVRKFFDLYDEPTDAPARANEK